MNSSRLNSPMLATALAALVLSACSPDADDSRTAGQKIDAAVATVEQKTGETVARVEQKAEELKADAKNAMAGAKNSDVMADAKESAKDAAARAEDATKSAAGTVADKIDDAAITVSVNAELAKDPSLSALKIDVDTEQGKVVLNGTAPDTQARERATQLASAVKGVVSVDNKLEVRS